MKNMLTLFLSILFIGSSLAQEPVELGLLNNVRNNDVHPYIDYDEVNHRLVEMHAKDATTLLINVYAHGSWTEITSLTVNNSKMATMNVHPETGEIWVAYVGSTGIIVTTFNGAAWNQVGVEFGDGNGTSIYAPDLEFADNGVPHVMAITPALAPQTYREYSHKVYKYANSSWTKLGGDVGLTYRTEWFDMEIHPSTGDVYVSYLDIAQYDWGNERVMVKKYSGAGWSIVGGATVGGDKVTYNNIAIDGNGDVFVHFEEPSNGQKLQKLNGSTWVDATSGGSTSLIGTDGEMEVYPGNGRLWFFAGLSPVQELYGNNYYNITPSYAMTGASYYNPTMDFDYKTNTCYIAAINTNKTEVLVSRIDMTDYYTISLGTIPDQTILDGELFTSVDLSAKVTYTYSLDSVEFLVASTNTALTPQIYNGYLTVSVANSSWVGAEDVVVEVRNKNDYSVMDRDTATFTVQQKPSFINEVNNNMFKIYPNPAASFIQLMNHVNNKSSLVIYNVLGEQVFSKGVVDNIKISLDDLTDGLYTVVIKSSHEQTIQKLLIKR